MNCKSYIELTPRDRQIFVAKLVHAVQNSEACFATAEETIDMAELLGIYRGTQFMPERDLDYRTRAVTL